MVVLGASLLARREAPLHLQLQLTRIPVHCPSPGDVVSIEGRVVRIFRGQALVETGADLSFPLWVCEEGDEPTGPAYVHHEALVAATHMEVYLYGRPPDCHLAGYEYVLLQGPTTDPTMSVNDLEKRLPRPSGRRDGARWWELWKR